MTEKRRIALIASIVLGGVVAVIIYGLLDPAKYSLFHKCPFFMISGGLRCPGCGSQRAIHALLNLEFKEAFLYNPMIIISIPFLLLLAAAYIFRDSHPGFYNKINSSLLSKLLLASFIGWWIIRNLIGL